ncbi:hypothetical protein ACFO4O_10625 [Glaciecola siphonariae]|uniref:Uncharacterized protein n=1 Tax=Glaciecola siphonariae TaxID=521012 RepID=A0ABV9LYA9_9ALTE
MKKGFVLACIAAFILLNEDLNHFIVMLVLGDFEVGRAWQRAFGNTSIESMLFSGGFRLIPFIPLVLCALCTNLLTHLTGKVTLWVGFTATIAIIFIGYWGVTEALYTDAHASSTSAIGYIWAPIAAAAYSLVACIVTYFLLWLFELVLKRA